MGDNNQNQVDTKTHLSVETNVSESMEIANDIQQWFSELSVEERASALGFVDRPVLSVFLEHASLSSSSSTSSPFPEKRVTDIQDITTLQTIDWNAMVSLNDLETSWKEETKDSETPIDANNVAVVANEKGTETPKKSSPDSATTVTPNHGKVGTNDEKERIESSDAFRIRDGGEVLPSAKLETEKSVDSANLVSPGSQASPRLASDNISDLMNNVCVIFQSTSKLHSSDAASGAHPFITLQPSYLRAQNGADVLSRLDEIMNQAIRKSSFSSNPDSASWKDVVKKAFEQSGNETATIPLYMILLLRMKLSIFESFQQCTADAAQKKASDGATEQEATSISCLSPMSEVLSRLGSISEMDAAQLRDISASSALSDFVKATQKGGHDLMFPLLTILQKVKSSSLSFDDTLASIDRAVAQVIERFNKKSSEDSTENNQAETDVSNENPKNNQDASSSTEKADGKATEAMKQTDQAAPQTANGKKKKKKKKKRKGSGNGQGQGPTSDQQTPTGQQSSTGASPCEGHQISPSDSKPNKRTLKLENDKEKPESSNEDETKDRSEAVVPSPDKTKESGKDNSDVHSALSESANEKDAEEDYHDNGQEVETNAVDENKGETEPSTETGSAEKTGQEQPEEEKKVDIVEADDQTNYDSGEWETVEVKPRGNRKKAADRANQGRFASNQNSNAHGGQNGNGSKKSKSNRNRKQKANTRKMAREIISTVLDRVDEDVRKRRKAIQEAPRPPVNKWAVASPSIKGKGAAGSGKPAKVPEQPGKERTMRDILVGRQTSNAVTVAASSHSPPRTLAQQVRQRPEVRSETKQGVEGKKTRDKPGSSKRTGTVFADQNTAPTVPETPSDVSAETPSRNAIPQDTGVAQGDSSAGDSGEGLKLTLSQVDKEVSPSPPLPTLLTENANSASSSVASSLDTSHAGHHGNRLSSNQGNEKDVGYHLLDVCDRLTRDINIFMKRREHALEIRRRERGSVLMALQGTLSSIWPGMCNVEMYGSCATQLDLPSSDLDVVVRGLDRPSEKFATSSSNVGKSNESSGDTKERNPEASPIGRVVNPVVVQHSPQMVYGHLSLNAERIVRLAMELERQPWAVHVKAIPTATVPVIKILADPTRTSGNGEWLMQPPIAAEASPANGQSMAEQAESNGATQNSMAHFQGQQTPPWRGADVMNGLLKVDITFEGPEHGGIGSTKFSSRVVKEFCDETGLPPDGTPAVQVLMVVKELLAQRRLNEPFSGGLSSYALLLFVISVLRERAIIREELEKVERQRRMVAAGNVDPGLRVFPSESVTSSGEKRDAASTSKTKATKAESLVQEKRSAKVRSGKITNDQVESGISSAANKNGKKEPELGKAKPPAAAAPAGTEKAGSSNASRPAASSWASIAKKSSSSAPPRKPIHERAQSNPSEKKAPQQQTKTLRKASSFADAVANGSQGGSKQPSNAAPPASKSKKGEVRNNSGNKAPPKKAPSNTKEKSSAQPSSASSGRDTNSQLDVQAPIAGSGSMFPQGFHDVTEVLCSGETTAGKLLMHFLLFYGQHFDSQSTAIDYSWTHQRDANGNNGYSQMSPYMLRRTAGSYDPMTGMLSVDPIVVYDPLEGAETNNVARSCFAWSSIRWVFAQSYLTLLSTVEINQNHTSGQGARGASVRSDGKKGTANENKSELSHPWNGPYGHDKSGNMMIDPSSPLLELLLSF